MSANVESLMYVRETPWHGLGTKVEEAPTSSEAIKLAGLDWKVNQQPVYTDNNIVIPNYKANVRDKDNKVLGIVTDRYKIVQNSEAFDFTDNLIGDDCKYETAGSLAGGRKIFLLAKMPERLILEEKFDPYICFTNTHDGSGSIKACCTNVRVVCQNTLNLAFNNASRSWSIRHTGNIKDKLLAAQKTLELFDKYNKEFEVYAEKAANTNLTKNEINNTLDNLFNIDDDMSDRRKRNIINDREKFEKCLVAIDLRPFYGTLYGLLNAASDFTYHELPNRITNNIQENRMLKSINGADILDRIMQMHPVK